MAQVIVALDVAAAPEAERFLERLGPEPCFVKVGLELFTREGPEMVRWLRARGYPVFLDLKLHDIPETVAATVRAAAALDVHFLTVHASGGRRMLEAAAAAANTVRVSSPEAGRPGAESEAVGSKGERSREGPGLQLLAVTVLTSLSGVEVGEAWGRGGRAGDPASDPADQVSPEVEVLRLASLAQAAGIPGVVASVSEARALRDLLGPTAPIVTPGIRFSGEEAHDQVRVSTPAGAALAGASHLVMGRSIRDAADPGAALLRARRELSSTPVRRPAQVGS